MIKAGRAEGFLAWHPDRLARNSIDGGRIIYLLDTGKLKDLKFPSFWFENTPQGKFMLNIAFGQSKYYVDNLSENVKRGNRQKLRQGIWPNKAPLGYYNDKQTKTIKVNPETSKSIKKAFLLFAEGNKSFTQISNFLFANGIAKANGKLLHINQIRRMLTRRFYVGVLNYGGEHHKASHECFISKKLFEEAQRQMKIKDKSRKRRRGRNFPFLGLVKCKQCGASITAEQHTKHYKRTNRTADYVYYRCTKKIGPCDQSYISQELLQRQFKKSISD
ncbi:recombinase family protein, partial [Patescibacteria group bacterium]